MVESVVEKIKKVIWQYYLANLGNLANLARVAGKLPGGGELCVFLVSAFRDDTGCLPTSLVLDT